MTRSLFFVVVFFLFFMFGWLVVCLVVNVCLFGSGWLVGLKNTRTDTIQTRHYIPPEQWSSRCTSLSVPLPSLQPPSGVLVFFLDLRLEITWLIQNNLSLLHWIIDYFINYFYISDFIWRTGVKHGFYTCVHTCIIKTWLLQTYLITHIDIKVSTY